jgi:hypothetical protein
MKVLECKNDLGSVESCLLFTKSICFPKVEEELPAVDEVHDHVEFLIRLKSVVELN